MKGIGGTSPNVSISRCTPAEYERLLRFLDVCFSKPERRWFDKYYGHIFQRNRPYVERTILVRAGTKLVGAVGVYPFRLRIGSAELLVGGVGSVSTHPSARGKGIMSIMLRHVNCVLREEGYDVSWLGGDRFRYRNYGWELGGRRYAFTVHARDIARYFPQSRQVSVRRAGKNDFALLGRLYRRFPSCVVRSRTDWYNRSRRRWLEISLATSRRGHVYMVSAKDDPGYICEIQGQPHAAVALLVKHMARRSIGRASIDYPCTSDPLSRMLQHVASDFCLKHKSQLQLVDVASTWRKLLPEARRRHPHLSRDALVRLRRTTSEADRRQVLGRLLGFCDDLPCLPKHLHKLEPLRPLGWWLSDYDGV